MAPVGKVKSTIAGQYADVSRLTKFIIANFTGKIYPFCVLFCLSHRFGVAINYKEIAKSNEPNCQLTNTTEQVFDENSNERDKGWTFQKVSLDRALVAGCTEEKYECQNGGTMIWDPVKPFICKCSRGFERQRCENATKNVLESEILKSELPEFKSKLEGWLPITGKSTVCWRASRDGWDVVKKFHPNCDGKKPTLTIVKVVNNNKNYIFGGYASVPWAGNDGATSAPGSFLFSLRNNDNLPPFNAPLKDQNDVNAIYSTSSCGPIFGKGSGLFIANNAKSNTGSHIKFGVSYQAPAGYSYGSDNTFSLLAGSKDFTPSEIEVFYLQN